MAFQKGNKYGNRFSCSNQPKKRGKRTNVFAQLRKDVEKSLGCKINEIDINSILAFAAMGTAAMHESYIVGEDGKSANPETPMILMNLIRAIQVQTKMGRTDTLERIIDRLFGKVAQPIEGDIKAEVSNGPVDLSMLSTEELMQYNQLLDKISKGKTKGDGKE